MRPTLYNVNPRKSVNEPDLTNFWGKENKYCGGRKLQKHTHWTKLEILAESSLNKTGYTGRE
jgi:hypothetical protein